MPQGINLTPPQEINRRRIQYAVGFSTKLAFLFLVISVGVAVYYFSKAAKLKDQIIILDNQKSELTSKRDSMKEVEDYAKKLSGKYFLLQKYLESRLRYSSVVKELLARVPEGVLFGDLDFQGVGKRTRVSGTSKDVISVSTFVNRLSRDGNFDKDSEVDLMGKFAFIDVRLESLNVVEGKEVNYAVSFKINEEAFLK